MHMHMHTQEHTNARTHARTRACTLQHQDREMPSLGWVEQRQGVIRHGFDSPNLGQDALAGVAPLHLKHKVQMRVPGRELPLEVAGGHRHDEDGRGFSADHGHLRARLAYLRVGQSLECEGETLPPMSVGILARQGRHVVAVGPVSQGDVEGLEGVRVRVAALEGVEAIPNGDLQHRLVGRSMDRQSLDVLLGAYGRGDAEELQLRGPEQGHQPALGQPELSHHVLVEGDWIVTDEAGPWRVRVCRGHRSAGGGSAGGGRVRRRGRSGDGGGATRVGRSASGGGGGGLCRGREGEGARGGGARANGARGRGRGCRGHGAGRPRTGGLRGRRLGAGGGRHGRDGDGAGGRGGRGVASADGPEEVRGSRGRPRLLTIDNLAVECVQHTPGEAEEVEPRGDGAGQANVGDGLRETLRLAGDVLHQVVGAPLVLKDQRVGLPAGRHRDRGGGCGYRGGREGGRGHPPADVLEAGYDDHNCRAAEHQLP
mmetsp:Transcript_128929/g.401107  ORF Transcript_128929/g.401107 Transcript_128929/m.401107 type:complete len:484 (+) Transcript_128929:2-1453(+)